MKAPRVGWADLRARKHAVRVQQDRMTGAGISPLFRQPDLLSSQRALHLAESCVRERRRESGRWPLPSARYVMSSSHSRHADRVLTRRYRQFIGGKGAMLGSGAGLWQRASCGRRWELNRGKDAGRGCATVPTYLKLLTSPSANNTWPDMAVRCQISLHGNNPNPGVQEKAMFTRSHPHSRGGD
jgi:hypothetical protein